MNISHFWRSVSNILIVMIECYIWTWLPIWTFIHDCWKDMSGEVCFVQYVCLMYCLKYAPFWPEFEIYEAILALKWFTVCVSAINVCIISYTGCCNSLLGCKSPLLRKTLSWMWMTPPNLQNLFLILPPKAV